MELIPDHSNHSDDSGNSGAIPAGTSASVTKRGT